MHPPPTFCHRAKRFGIVRSGKLMTRPAPFTQHTFAIRVKTLQGLEYRASLILTNHS